MACRSGPGNDQLATRRSRRKLDMSLVGSRRQKEHWKLLRKGTTLISTSNSRFPAFSARFPHVSNPTDWLRGESLLND